MATDSASSDQFLPLTAGSSTCTWSRSFPATLAHASTARRFLSDLLGDHSSADDAILCLSEICANAIQHSRSARLGGIFTVSVTLTPDLLRVEVNDEGGPWQAHKNGDPQRGRGLVIVHQLAKDWGISNDNPASRTVWFEMQHT